MAARIEREREPREATVSVGTVHARERGQGRLARRGSQEASNLIVASCLTITDTGFCFIEMTDFDP